MAIHVSNLQAINKNEDDEILFIVPCYTQLTYLSHYGMEFNFNLCSPRPILNKVFKAVAN
jgi:hypothetical protein